MSRTPFTDLILLLEAYDQSHSTASVNLKKAIWDIHMARHVKGNVPTTGGEQQVYTALNIREELRPQLILQQQRPFSITPTLGDEVVVVVGNEEFKDERKEGPKDTCYSFVLRNASSVTDWVPSTDESSSVENDDPGASEKFGLRHRKKPQVADIQEESKWTQENYGFVDDEDEMEKRLQSINPLHLFGALPPRALKDAQIKAGSSLNDFVHTANIGRAILDLLRQMNSNSQST